MAYFWQCTQLIKMTTRQTARVMHQENSPRHWFGSILVESTVINGVTKLKKISHQGPLRIQRPFYPGNDGQCHAYILHPPGGMACGDILSFNVRCGNNSHLLLTTPAAGKVYGLKGLQGEQHQNIELIVAQNAILEWLPQETIVYDSARLNQSTHIYLHKDSSLISMDIQCLGRRLSGESFLQGSMNLSLKLFIDEQLLHQEKLNVEPEKQPEVFQSDAGYQGKSVNGTLIMANKIFESEEVLDSLWQELEEHCQYQSLVSITRKGSLVIARYLGDKPEQARELLTLCRNAGIEAITGNSAIEPRIWNT